jgi:hypothetical protein
MDKNVIRARELAKKLRDENTTRETFVRAQLTGVFEDKLVQAISEFELLEPKQKWDVLLRMLPYITPKLNNVSIDSKKSRAIDLLMERMGTGMTDVEAEEIKEVEKLLK